MSLSIDKSCKQLAISPQDKTEDKPKEKYNWLKNTGSVALGYVGYKTTKHFGNIIVAKAANSYFKETTFSSFILNGRTAKSIFDNSGLANKGVVLKNIDYSKLKSNATLDYLKNSKELLKRFKLGSLLEKFGSKGMESAKNMTTLGINSFYDYKNKTILNNFKKLGMAIPHEMGYAANYNSKNPLLKVLTKSRYLQLLTPAILAVALLRKPKQEGQESSSIVGKSLDFVKENCVGITAACMSPTIIEEGLASIRGAKMAKQFLSPEKLKAVNIANFKGWTTYAITAGIAVAGVYIANKIRNATAPKSEMERDVKYKQAENLDKVA